MIFVHDISPELVRVGEYAIRWYGLLFAAGILLNYFFLRWVWKREKYGLERLDSLVVYLAVAMVLGARLGHVLFYNASYFWEHPLEILMIWKGGLSSHGAAIGVLVAYALWTRVKKVKFSKYVDAAIIAFPLTSGFVRLGNFMNSEIVGVRADGDFGVVFSRLGETFARHPVQLYEAGVCFAVFAVLVVVYKKYYKKLPAMFLLNLYLGLYFIGRFFVEEWKDLHTLPADFPLSMGQVLSLPFIIASAIYFVWVYPRLGRRE